MMSQELEMVESNYEVISNRICLLSNYLPSTNLDDVENPMNARLFMNNLSLRRKNAHLNN